MQWSTWVMQDTCTSENMLKLLNKFDNFQKCKKLTYKRDYQDAEKNPERIAKNVHEDNRDQGDAEIALTLPPLALLATQNLEIEY